MPQRAHYHNTLQVVYVLVLLLLCDVVHAQTCNTNQNPSCAGVAVFEALCCNWPDVCYWRDRDGSAGCCPAGQNCRGDGGAAPATDVATSYPYTTITSTFVGVVSTPTETPTTLLVTETSTTPLVTVTTTASAIRVVVNGSPTLVPQLGWTVLGVAVVVWPHVWT